MLDNTRVYKYGELKGHIETMLREGYTYTKIREKLHCSFGTISYHAKNLELNDPSLKRSGTKYNWKNIQKYYDEKHTAEECMINFGFTEATWALAIKRGRILARGRAKPIEEFFGIKARRMSGPDLRKRLLNTGLATNECAICGIADWNGLPLNLQVDHINGKSNDNRIENLRLLCPNCHAQTETYCGKIEGKM